MSSFSDHLLFPEESLRLENGVLAHRVILRCGGFLRRNRHWNFPRVFSPYWRLYYNFTAGHHVEQDGRIYPLAPGHFLLIPDNLLFHCVSSQKACDHFYLHFQIPAVSFPSIDQPIRVPADAVSLAMVKNMCQELASEDFERCACLGISLLNWLFGHLPITETPRFPSPNLQRLLTFAETNPGAPLTNAALAKMAGVSQRGLIRLFERELNASPQAWVRETRLREAARRLAHQPESIDQIAEALGFPNRSYFTRRFTRHFKISPAAFRQKFPGASRTARRA